MSDISNKDTGNALGHAKEMSKEQGRRLWEIIKRYSQVDRLTVSSKGSVSVLKPPPKKRYSSVLLSILSIFPYLLLLTFGFSFYWDFDGITSSFFNYPLEFQGLLKIVSVSGLIGFLTNWVAITMLFKPAKRRPLLGHGLIPAQKDRIAFRLAQAVSEDLINPDIIKQKINESNIISKYRKSSTRYVKNIIDNPNFREELKQWVVTYLNEMIADPNIRAALAERILQQIEEAIQDKSFEKVALKAYSYVKGQEMQHVIEEALTQIPTSVESGLDKVDELLDQLPKKIDDHSEVIENTVTNLLYKLINQLDVHKLVEENLRSYDEQHISDIIQNATNEQLRYIQYLGAVLGLIGGFIIWEPLISLSALGIIFISVLALDHLLYRQFYS
ncbi:DUF445 domain-containing protein [Aliifodinibius salicampi]|uniref:DUF445 domain-containing protein n=1 Tax=Fodinibius salicampi TaxID=1920655 RepID=A0ABT3PVV0_9BACT|nr:DUF445 family protein [Fodinibius salicampi]MCW9711980.1 DUF445 domain-containing protein [Fodinibius salicampi]